MIKYANDLLLGNDQNYFKNCHDLNTSSTHHLVKRLNMEILNICLPVIYVSAFYFEQEGGN